MFLLVLVWALVCWFVTSTLNWEWWAGVLLFWVAPIPFMALLRRIRSGAGDPAHAEAVLQAWRGYGQAFRAGDEEETGRWWYRFQLAVREGGYAHIQGKIREYAVAGNGTDERRMQRAASALSDAVLDLDT